MRALESALRQWLREQLAGLGHSAEPRMVALKVEASHRYFFRVGFPGELAASYVLMSSPPELENNRQFETLASVFAAHGVGVPRILAKQQARGWYLLSDLGDVHLEQVYDTPRADAAVEQALETLIRIQAIDDPAVPPYTRQRFADELDIFRHWFVEAWLQTRFPQAQVEDVFDLLIEDTQSQAQVCVHRDFHCRNLLLGERGIGVVDFQDALVGPAAYDLASLLRDCYHRFSEAEISRWQRRYLELTALPLDATRFAAHLDLTAVQRLLKAVGIFARLELRDGKKSHLPYIPSTLTHIHEVSTRYPELAPLRAHVEGWQRAAVAKLADAK